MNYYELEPEQNTFYTLLADVTHKCNMECANCYIPNRLIPDMDKDKFQDFLSRLPKRTDIRLIGAEATMRDDLPELIQMIRKTGHHPALLTNGLKLRHYDYCQSLWNSGLRSLGISLNGAADDEVYKVIDNGKYAFLKTKALENCFRIGFVTHINCIIARDVNEHTIKELFDLTIDKLKVTGRPLKKSYPIMLRFKSIGAIGRYMENASFTLEELANLVADQLHVDKKMIMEMNQINGFTECNSLLFPVQTELGKLYVKLTDWSIDDDGIPDSGSQRRGRITQDFKIAPFFEHVKLNEGGY